MDNKQFILISLVGVVSVIVVRVMGHTVPSLVKTIMKEN